MKLRSVDTAFWSDPFVENLDPIEKLMFLYLLTNPLTTLSGIYEISVKRIGNETGIDRDMVKKLLDRFEEAGKVYYYENHIILANYQSHQKYNPMMQKNVVDQMSKLPEEVLSYVEKLGRRNPEMKESVVINDQKEKPTPLPLEERRKRFTLAIRDFNHQIPILKDDDENEFIAYWTECNQGAKKFRAEMEKVFDIKRRMETWQRNIDKRAFTKKAPVVTGTGRVVSQKDTDEFKKLVMENNKKIESSGLYNPNNDPEYLKLMGRVANG